jgi:hypothetical protein
METTLGRVTSSAKLRLRSGFAGNHIRAAIRDAREAYDLEKNNDTTQLAAWFDDILAHVPAAIVMAAAALEANANEIVQDYLDQPSQLAVAQVCLFKDLLDDRSGNAVGKYRNIALILGKLPQKGNVVWQNALLLTQLRNHFMHFKPSWDHETSVHEGTLAKSLRAKIPTVSFYKSGFMFPYGVMNYACARWAVESAQSFSAYFSGFIGVKDKLSGNAPLP